MSQQAIFNRMKRSADRMMENLMAAHNIARPEDPQEEMMLLEALAKGQDMKKALEKISRRKKKSSPRP